ncbi:Homeobox protein MSX-1 [Acropora cervicornis]|uniref:Homeobox protein MSX-1 n=1 Tax=Acropora cervicornis TaxID=6130 RepID=A0AAD9V467_ACRCE|nr:Homeobox protein MSX-1 [Acropora cervicornis]
MMSGFSLDNLILAKKNILRSPGTFGAQKPRRSETPEERQIGNNDTTGMIHEETLQTRLPWLAYTRYCPPKLPRSKPRKGCRRHKLNRSPRIPFSSSQLASLEAKFLQTQYLSGSEVHDLSSWLSVSEHRVKIWFQNRRAREKKTKAVSVVTSKEGNERYNFYFFLIHYQGQRCFDEGHAGKSFLALIPGFSRTSWVGRPYIFDLEEKTK